MVNVKEPVFLNMTAENEFCSMEFVVPEDHDTNISMYTSATPEKVSDLKFSVLGLGLDSFVSALGHVLGSPHMKNSHSKQNLALIQYHVHRVSTLEISINQLRGQLVQELARQVDIRNVFNMLDVCVGNLQSQPMYSSSFLKATVDSF